MNRLIVGLGCALALTGCDEIAMPTGGGAGFPMASAVTGGGNGRMEFLVLGSNMGFEECRSRGGIIIRDSGSPMIACDPRVRREPVPANEFDHPGSPVPQTAEVVDG
ncbi:hypothetical protein L0666_06325 [Octadecabacter sp. CECT 8868]|uniref:hypothetical protein n=1 Tax=Octadecabacter algicola TaxID=2909342 RepID=UPI001F45C350|nr:hypothetical protein [Octadecabacter algicola]MCF2904596.1 hypothetical protein [Octadecabacter algicola]